MAGAADDLLDDHARFRRLLDGGIDVLTTQVALVRELLRRGEDVGVNGRNAKPGTD